MASGTLGRVVAAAVVVVAMTPSIGAAGADFRSPDTREASLSAHLDARSPDTKEVAAPGDPRALDAIERLRAERRAASEPVFVQAPGFDWEDAAVGAVTTLGLVLVAAGARLLHSHKGAQVA